MAFNHYSKMKRILDDQPEGWFIRRINKSTRATNFKGETIEYNHYYRIYNARDEPIRYCKFQQIERLAKTLDVQVEELPIIDN